MTERNVPDPGTLIAPIPGPNPAGRPLPESIRRRLEDARRVIDPAAFAANDPLRPATRKDPDWNEIVSLCASVLTTTSKDLNVAARLTEALTELYGFAGLAAGLRVLRTLVQDAWDRVYPAADDPDARALPFEWLAAPSRGARFPAKVRLVPLFQTDAVSLSWQVWRESQDGRSKTPLDPDSALRDIPRRDSSKRVEELTRCHDELAALDHALADHMGDSAPALKVLAVAVEDCLGLARHLAQQIRTGAPSAPSQAVRPVVAAPPANLPFAPPADRDEILQQLSDAAAALQELEPHSPVPHVLFWAIGLARLPAADAVRELLPDLGAPNGWAPELVHSSPTLAPPPEDA